MARYGSNIYWLEGAPHAPNAPLTGAHRADVVIIGGGFTGLWTAYELKRSDPSAEVVVLEGQEIAYGASGRNGGFAMTLLGMSLRHVVDRWGVDAARAAHEAVARSVSEIGTFSSEHSVDCDYHRGGLLVVATNESQERRVQRDLEAAQKVGLSSITAMDAGQLQSEVRSPTYRTALLDENCATIHPARLVRGLKRVLEEMGVRIFEGSPVAGLDATQNQLRIRSGEGYVDTAQVVLATNAWAHRLPQFKRKVVPLYSYIILTEPLDDTTWAEIGWEGRQGIEDKRNFVHYYRRTADGRILWGGRDGVVYARNKIDAKHDSHDGVFRKLEETFRKTFPQAKAARITHRWGGPVAVTTEFVPLFGSLEAGRVHYGLGYNGHGVAPSHLGGKILSDLVLGKSRGYTDLFFVGANEHSFPPEPLTWLGAELTRRILLSQDRRMDQGKNVGDMDPLVLRLASKFG